MLLRFGKRQSLRLRIRLLQKQAESFSKNPTASFPLPRERDAVESLLDEPISDVIGSFAPEVLDKEHHDPKDCLPLADVIEQILVLAQAMSQKKFYAYQIEPAFRIVESLLDHDGEVITALISRQSGKTEMIGSLVSAIATILPSLAKKFPGDYRLNMTNEEGAYKGFANGIRIGIYGPRLDQADIMFQRAKVCFETKVGEKVLRELGVKFEVNNGTRIKLGNGSTIVCESASEQSKIEGETYNLLILEEAQDISDTKVRRSLHPMVSAYMGTIVKVGTATTQKCDFYTAIKTNERSQLISGSKKNHFFYPYTVCQKYNSFYRKYIKMEMQRIGENSDEFRTSYCAEWIFERGMFITDERLFNREVCMTTGPFSQLWDFGLPIAFRHYSIVAGIDWGSSHDSTVVTLMAVDWNNPIDSGESVDSNGQLSRYVFYRKHIINWIEFIGDNYEHQFGEIYGHLSKLPGLAKIVTDSNTCGKPIYDRLVSVFGSTNIVVEPFNFSAQVKSDGYRSFYGDICAKRVTFPASKSVRSDMRFRRFVNQLRDMKKEYKNGIMKVAHPDEKGAMDDYCFPATAPVLTDRGSVPISEVREGDLVWTREGWNRVLISRRTGTKPVIRAGNIVGTANHPVYSARLGMYVRLDSLMSNDTVLECAYSELPNSLTVSGFTDTRYLNEDSTENTFGLIAVGKRALSHCTDMCGKSHTALSLKGLWFITKTAIARIIDFPISALCPEASTSVSICPSLPELRSLRSTYLKPKKPLKYVAGTSSLRLEKQCLFELRSNLKGGRPAAFPAQSAELTTQPKPQERHTLVPRSVRHVAGDSLTLKHYENTRGEDVPVYNLTVDKCNEYVCQGVLVHNCDAAMLAAWGAATPTNTMLFETSGEGNPFFRR